MVLSSRSYKETQYGANNKACLETLLQKDLSEPEFYGNLVFKVRKTGKTNFSEQQERLYRKNKKKVDR